jgi:hypothetical protein
MRMPAMAASLLVMAAATVGCASAAKDPVTPGPPEAPPAKRNHTPLQESAGAKEPPESKKLWAVTILNTRRKIVHQFVTFGRPIIDESGDTIIVAGINALNPKGVMEIFELKRGRVFVLLGEVIGGFDLSVQSNESPLGRRDLAPPKGLPGWQWPPLPSTQSKKSPPKAETPPPKEGFVPLRPMTAEELRESHAQEALPSS